MKCWKKYTYIFYIFISYTVYIIPSLISHYSIWIWISFILCRATEVLMEKKSTAESNCWKFCSKLLNFAFLNLEAIYLALYYTIRVQRKTTEMKNFGKKIDLKERLYQLFVFMPFYTNIPPLYYIQLSVYVWTNSIPKRITNWTISHYSRLF